MNPFFSVCIPATDREKTIYRTLKSVSEQTFTDFEVIISLCISTDGTETEIQRFLESADFKQKPFTYVVQKLDYVPKTVEDWNEPLKVASGKYIAMLEGDDQFLPDHLQTAFDFLSKNEQVGLYFPGNKYPKQLLSGEDAFLKLYELKAIPAPSDAIFLATAKGEKFMYNETEYNYCPEVELYLTISLRGYSAFYSGENGVIRDKSVTKSRAKWRYYRDHFYILDKFRETNEGTKRLYPRIYRSIRLRATDALIHDKIAFKSEEAKDLKKELINKFGSFGFKRSLWTSYLRVIRTFIRKRLK